MSSAIAAQNERLIRKRLAAKLRQQRCRERKRMALLKKTGQLDKMHAKQVRTKREMGTSSSKHFVPNQRASQVASGQLVVGYQCGGSRIQRPDRPVPITMDKTMSAMVQPSHFHVPQYPSKSNFTPIATSIYGHQGQYQKVRRVSPEPSPEITAIDAMLSLKQSDYVLRQTHVFETCRDKEPKYLSQLQGFYLNARSA